VLYDLGFVKHREPFKKLFHQGMMQGEDGEKMSKSRGNVVNPDDVVAEYGADTFRLFEMFLGPVEKSKPWQTSSIEGVYRFLNKYWKMCIDEYGELSSQVEDIPESEWSKKFQNIFHKTIKQVTGDIEGMRHNTSISAMMILLNEAHSAFNGKVPREFVSTFTLLLAPLAPHITEEVWSKLGNSKSHRYATWPSFDPAKVESDDMRLAVQINGKVRDNVVLPRDTTEEDIRERVMALPKIAKWIEGKEIRKFIYIKGKLVSIVL